MFHTNASSDSLSLFSPEELDATASSSLSTSPSFLTRVSKLIDKLDTKFPVPVASVSRRASIGGSSASTRASTRASTSTIGSYRTRSGSSPPITSVSSLSDRESYGPLTKQKKHSITSQASTESLPCLDRTFTHTIYVPEDLKGGVSFLKITQRKRVQRLFVIDAVQGILSWNPKKSSSQLAVDRIYEILVGADSRSYREQFKVSAEYTRRWATILYYTEDRQLRALHIVAPSESIFNDFVSFLRALVKHRQELMSGLAMPEHQFVRVHWSKYVKESAGGGEFIDFSAVERLARRLQINCSKAFLESLFRHCDGSKTGTLTIDEFKDFVRQLKARREVEDLYNVVRGDSAYLMFSEFKTFVLETQKEKIAPDGLERLFVKYARNSTHITCDEFAELLSSSAFPLLKPPNPNEMDRPLNEYYVSSSHNTYLVGRQIVGVSSVEMYIRSLQNGCRCVEIDCWDGDTGPVVQHGHTFSKAVDFVDVVEAVRKYAFIASPYPLIVSLEIRCSAANQLKMVSILTSCLGEALVTRALAPDSLTLPSPEQLKHRILIKVKSESSSGTTNSVYNGSSSFEASTTSLSDLVDLKSPGKVPKQPKKKQTRVVKELSDLGVYISGVKFRNFSLPVSKTTNHVFSLSERTLNQLMRDPEKRQSLLKHNKRFLMRVYPSAYRVRSKNFDPVPYWKQGVQMVALNWQTNDVGLQLNEAMFDPHFGYVLKPASLLPVDKKTSWFSRRHHGWTLRKPDENEMLKFELRIISAQQLPRVKDVRPEETIDPYVSVELFGVDTPESAPSGNRWVTPKVIDNGLNPIWNSSFTIQCRRKDLEFAFVRLAVYTGDRVFALNTVRLTNLNQGFRHLPLHDLQGEEYIFSSLFIFFRSP